MKLHIRFKEKKITKHVEFGPCHIITNRLRALKSIVPLSSLLSILHNFAPTNLMDFSPWCIVVIKWYN